MVEHKDEGVLDVSQLHVLHLQQEDNVNCDHIFFSYRKSSPLWPLLLLQPLRRGVVVVVRS